MEEEETLSEPVRVDNRRNLLPLAHNTFRLNTSKSINRNNLTNINGNVNEQCISIRARRTRVCVVCCYSFVPTTVEQSCRDQQTLETTWISSQFTPTTHTFYLYNRMVIWWSDTFYCHIKIASECGTPQLAGKAIRRDGEIEEHVRNRVRVGPAGHTVCILNLSGCRANTSSGWQLETGQFRSLIQLIVVVSFY